MKIKTIIIGFILFGSLAAVLYAQGETAQPVVNLADGSSQDKAIVIKDISDYTKCTDDDCYDTEYGKSIEQEYGFIGKQFGEQGKEWAPVNQELLNDEKNNKYWDAVTIELTKTKEETTVYFDISEPFVHLNAILAKQQPKETKENNESQGAAVPAEK